MVSADEIRVSRSRLQQLLVRLDQSQRQCERLQSENEALAEQISLQKLKLESLSVELAPSMEQMTWEQRRALILAQLEREENQESDNRQHLIDVVAETNRVVQERDEEIRQLQELLKQRPSDVEDNTVVGAVAIAQLLDSDELIQKERDKLVELQEEWRAKIRDAEIEMSLERARLARQAKENHAVLSTEIGQTHVHKVAV